MADSESRGEALCDQCFVVKADSAARRKLVERLKALDIVARPFAESADFIEALPHLMPGCVILDMNMGGTGGLSLLRQMQEQGYFWPAIIVAADGDIPAAVRAIRLGAVEFLTKPYSEGDLFRALAECHATLPERVERSKLAQKAKSLDQLLSRRERDVFERLTRGMTNKEVAKDLALSPRTVESHRSLIMAKLGVRRVLELYRIAEAGRSISDL